MSSILAVNNIETLNAGVIPLNISAPSVTLNGAPLPAGNITVPTTWSPTFTGFGAVTVFDAKSWRSGPELVFEITFALDTPTGVEARVSLGYAGTNSNVTTANNYPALQYIGSGASDYDSMPIYVFAEAAKSYIVFGNQKYGFEKRNGDQLGVLGTEITIKGSVRIQGW